MISDHLIFDSTDVEVVLSSAGPSQDNDPEEQIRRLVTKKRTGHQHFSFHLLHFNANLEKDMRIWEEPELDGAEQTEVCYFILSGSAEVEWNGNKRELRPGTVMCVAPHVEYVHRTGPQGMTMVVVVAPPFE